MEKDDEVNGEGNTIHYEFRDYDTRIARFKSLDPKSFVYPWQSPFVYHRNNPINLADYLGLGDPPSARDTPLNVVVIRAHQAFSRELQNVDLRIFNTTAVLQNNKRPDVIDETNNIVWELKPKSWMPLENTKAKFNKATKQTDGYFDQLNMERPEVFTKGSGNPVDAPSFYVPQASDGNYIYTYFCPDPSIGIVYYEAKKIEKPDSPGLPVAGQKDIKKPDSKISPNQKPVLQLVPYNSIRRSAYDTPIPNVDPETVKKGAQVATSALLIAIIIEYWPVLLL